MNTLSHRAGFIHLIGKPNAGKSTLFNHLVQYPLSIVSPKPQTTRQNILGIQQGPNHQAVYVDTPGHLKPAYQLQKIMMRHVRRALIASDLLLWVVDIREDTPDPLLLEINQKQPSQTLLLLNKIDLLQPDDLSQAIARWQAHQLSMMILPICAKDPQQVTQLSQKIHEQLPIHPPYYDKDTLTDKSQRFFAAEILRKALFLQYKAEIPYSTEVCIENFQETADKLRIDATLYVERLNQKQILIGAKGQAIKKLGMEARKELEHFFQKKVFLAQYVKVLPNWRDKACILGELGYR